jgi:hypothetical protein
VQSSSKLWNKDTLDFDTVEAAPEPIDVISFKKRFTLDEHAILLGVAKEDNKVAAFLV